MLGNGGCNVHSNVVKLTFSPGYVIDGELSNSSSDESITGASSSNESLCEVMVEVESGDKELVLVPKCSIVSNKL